MLCGMKDQFERFRFGALMSVLITIIGEKDQSDEYMVAQAIQSIIKDSMRYLKR